MLSLLLFSDPAAVAAAEAVCRAPVGNVVVVEVAAAVVVVVVAVGNMFWLKKGMKDVFVINE